MWTRLSTPHRRNPDGSTTLIVKRCCDGCGRELGDAHERELTAAVYGSAMPTARGECGCGPNPVPSYVYVASSWRCALQPIVVQTLKAAGIDHYDFRNPTGRTGFGWSQTNMTIGDDGLVDVDDYRRGLRTATAAAGFTSDFNAMKAADAFVLVLPCNRSAHLELGWAIGQGKRTAILLDGPRVTPELMYLCADFIAADMGELLEWLGVPE